MHLRNDGFPNPTSCIRTPRNACASRPEAGARCGSAARRDRCGGCRVTGIPTATVTTQTQRRPPMSRMIIVNLPVQYAAALAVVMLVALCAAAAGDEFAGREKLRAHSKEFRKEVIRVTDGVYLAVGYSASNVTLIRCDGGSIIVDTSSDPVEGREVRAAFGHLLDAPVRTIIYTHGHPNHTGGAAVFAVTDYPDIYSHQLLVEGGPDIVRGMRDGGDQFGMTLPDALYINAGIQLQYGRVTPPTREGYVPPTRTFS